MDYRVLEVYLDVELSQQVNAGGAVLPTSQKFTLHRCTKTIVRAHLLRADGTTYVQPPAGAVFFFGLDNSFSPSNSDPVATLNANFNQAGYWSALDVANGKIAWLVDTATDALATAMGSLASLPNAKAELWMAPSVGADFSLLCQWDVDMLNVVTAAGATSSLPYYLNSLLAFDGDDVVLYYPDGSVAQRWSKT